jgi:hypothetical protein
MDIGTTYNPTTGVGLALARQAAAGVRPARAVVRRWKSSRDLVAGTEANRKAPTARGALKEAV